MAQRAVSSVWIRANAGSGKTTTLTGRVVRLLLLGVAPEHILCITYTKAAASEMRQRVLAKLRVLLLASEADCRAEVKKILQEEPDSLVLQRARTLFTQVLDSPFGGVQLTTIHGFCQSILARFPLEAGLTPHFSVLEDEEAKEVLEETSHALIRGITEADVWLQDALGLIGARGGEYRFDELVADIVKRRAFWQEVWRGQSHASLRAHLFRLHGFSEETSADSLQQEFMAALSSMDDAVMRQHLPELLASSIKGTLMLGEQLARWLAAPHEERIALIPDLRRVLLTSEAKTFKDVLGKSKAFKNHEALVQAVARLGQALEDYTQRQASLACAEESFAVAVLARVMLELYAQAKASRLVLDYDDLITYTLRLFLSAESLGWVMRKLDHRIDHLLIDEAQDNSGAMWQLARCLVEEFFASPDGIGDGGLPRSVLVVGDEKQSIYSFQGAAPQKFQEYRGVIGELLSFSASPLQEEGLRISYRSVRSVLGVVNQLGTFTEVAQALAGDGEVMEHTLHRADGEGAVVLYPPLEAAEKTRDSELQLPSEYAVEANDTELLANHIATQVASWLGKGEGTARWLEAQQRFLQAGDILILVKHRKPLVPPLIRALQRKQVPVAGIDRLMLADHLAVRDLLALMAWVDNRGDDLALAQVLRSPLVGMTDECLCALAQGRPKDLWEVVEEPWLQQVLGWARLNPYEFLTQVLEVSGKRRDFARRFGEEVHEVLDELKLQAMAMPRNRLPSLAHFHDWISQSTTEIKREQEGGDRGVVRIMTVHGAKGLEAPVVILADTVKTPTTQFERLFILPSAEGQALPVLSISPQSKIARRLEDAKSLRRQQLNEEYLRLLYVAVTRARDELHIFGQANQKGEIKSGSWYDWLKQAMQALGTTEDASGNYCYGCISAALSLSPEVAASASATLPDWAQQRVSAMAPSVATRAPSALRSSAERPHFMQLGGGGRERGVRLHRVLELLTRDSTAEGIAALVRMIAPDWTEAEQVRTVAEVVQLHHQERWLWEYPRLTEASIAGMVEQAGQAVAMSGQMDLVVLREDDVIVIDYKTGAQVPRDASEVPLNYLLQLKTYRALLTKVYPGKPVRCAILWTAVPLLMWLDAAVDKAQFEGGGEEISLDAA